MNNLTLIFEGCDSSGKSTIAKALKQKYPDLDIADRAFISDEVYAKKFKRDIYLNVPIKTYLEYWSSWYKYKGDSRVILFVADVDILTDRCIAKCDDICKGKTRDEIYQELKADQESFIECTQKYSTMFKTKIIKTNDSYIDVRIKEIEDFINDIQL